MSLSSVSKSKAFKTPQEYQQVELQSFSVYDAPAQFAGLRVLEANHCFCIIKLRDNAKYKLEAGKNQQNTMSVSYEPIGENVEGFFITKVNFDTKKLNFKKLGEFIKANYENKSYNIQVNNCFDVPIKILKWLGFQKEANQVKDRKSFNFNNGVGMTYKIAGFLFGVILFATTKKPQAMQYGYRIAPLMKAAGVGVSKILSKIFH